MNRIYSCKKQAMLFNIAFRSITIASLIIFSLPVTAQVWTDFGFPGQNKTVNTIEVNEVDNKAYVGGSFTNIPGAGTVNNVAMWDGVQWNALGDGFDDEVKSLKFYNNELYAGGDFIYSGTELVNGIAKWNGTSWESVGLGAAGSLARINALEVFNGELYAGGYFLQMNGLPIEHLAKWDGSNWTAINSSFNAEIYALHTFDGKIFIGNNGLYSWDSQTLAYIGNVSGQIYALSSYGGNLFVGGSFSAIGGGSGSITGYWDIRNLASWNGNKFEFIGGTDSWTDTGANSLVYSIMSYNCQLYIGGVFNSMANIPVDGLATWDGVIWSDVIGSNTLNTTKICAFHSFQDKLMVGGLMIANTGSCVGWDIPSSSGAPVGSFASNWQTIATDGVIEFTNTTTNADYLRWSFPGGSPSTSAFSTPPHVTYPNSGLYDVELIVTNCIDNDTLKAINYVEVFDTLPPIDFGSSTEYLKIKPPRTDQLFPLSYSYNSEVTYINDEHLLYEIHYYKPLDYDSTSPILMYVHGVGGSGASSADLQNIADRQKALIVAPSMQGVWAFVQKSNVRDINTGCNEPFWLTELTKQVYRNVLKRERRDSIPVYLTGFSAGGQFTSRYMFIRQVIPDSIPIQMTLTASGAAYTFMTESFNGETLYFNPWSPNFMCGLAGDHLVRYGCTDANNNLTIPATDFICEGHIKQYYNENMAIIVGTNDIGSAPPTGGYCGPQGPGRYSRARNFYAFSDTNAISRGTTLQWVIDSVQGAGHSQYTVYNAKLNPSDTFTIAENLLFNTPWHPVPQFAAHAAFTANATTVDITNPSVQFNNLSTPGTYLWDFGDGNTSTDTNPIHSYGALGYYTVSLTVENSGCGDSIIKHNYISVDNSLSLNEQKKDHSLLKVYPNPFSNEINISIDLSNSDSSVELQISNAIGNILDYTEIDNPSNNKHTFNTLKYDDGIYFLILVIDGAFVEITKLVHAK